MTLVSIKKQYQELVALTQKYLMQEFALRDRKSTDYQTYMYFKQSAKQDRIQEQKELQPAPSYPVSATPARPQALPTPVPSPIVPPPQDAVIKPEPVPPAQSKTDSSTKKSFFERDPMPPAPDSDFGDIPKIVADKFPTQKLLDYVLGDDEAKKINTGWQTETPMPEILLLSFNESPKQKAFLTNMAKAIQFRLGTVTIFSAQKIEHDKGWEAILRSKTLRLIIASDCNLSTFPLLMKHYREVPKQAKHFLGKVPLYLLSDLSLYLKEPQLKPSLWQAILSTPL